MQELKVSLQQATKPISERVRQSQLVDRFDTVNKLLGQQEVDKEELKSALELLQSEMNTFVANWEAEVVSPMWQAQDAIAKTADQVRLLLARGRGGQPGEEARKRLENYDRRLENLAMAIRAERDPKRRERLEATFANVLSLRQLVEQLGSVNLGPANEQVYARIVQALTGLEDQLNIATFQLERTRLVLSSQSEFVGQYLDILTGLIHAEDLAKMLAGMEEAGQGLGTLSIDLSALHSLSERFADLAGSMAGRLSDSIEVETARIADRLGNTGISPGNLQQEIDRYHQSGTARAGK